MCLYIYIYIYLNATGDVLGDFISGAVAGHSSCEIISIMIIMIIMIIITLITIIVIGLILRSDIMNKNDIV